MDKLVTNLEKSLVLSVRTQLINLYDIARAVVFPLVNW